VSVSGSTMGKDGRKGRARGAVSPYPEKVGKRDKELELWKRS